MKAAICYERNQPVRIEDVQLDPPRRDEVRVRIAATGVCHSDLSFVQGIIPGKLPCVLGHEGAGVVEEVGEGVTQLSRGDKVVLAWVTPCLRCFYCRIGKPELCELGERINKTNRMPDGTSRAHKDGQDLYVFSALGTMAELATVPANAAVKLPEDAPLDRCALLGCAVTTGVGAVINTAKVGAGETVTVVGAGGVGLSAIQGARLAKAARIVAVDVQPDKLEVARRLGATETIDARAGDPVAALHETVPEGLDFVFDALGRIETTEQAIAALGLGGAAVIVGLPPTGSKASFDPLVLAESNQRVLGSNYGSVDPQRDIPRLVDLYMEGELDLDALVSGRRPLAEAAEALDDLAAGRVLRTLLTNTVTP
jgi:S-(hydroxymethyl)glutathione dehydrogenase/alcohol dehydrogenase